MPVCGFWRDKRVTKVSVERVVSVVAWERRPGGSGIVCEEGRGREREEMTAICQI